MGSVLSTNKSMRCYGCMAENRRPSVIRFSPTHRLKGHLSYRENLNTAGFLIAQSMSWTPRASPCTKTHPQSIIATLTFPVSSFVGLLCGPAPCILVVPLGHASTCQRRAVRKAHDSSRKKSSKSQDRNKITVISQ
jgi:hypothetical protein